MNNKRKYQITWISITIIYITSMSIAAIFGVKLLIKIMKTYFPELM